MIKDGYKQNFETLLDAAANGDLALVECTDKEGRPVITICAIVRTSRIKGLHDLPIRGVYQV